VPHPNPRLGYALVVLAAVLFGLNGGVSRIAMGSGLSPESFTTLRITGATLVFVALGVVGVTGLQLTYNVAIDRLPGLAAVCFATYFLLGEHQPPAEHGHGDLDPCASSCGPSSSRPSA
jgi:drug/metabolite transporter (DMT)-like permease